MILRSSMFLPRLALKVQKQSSGGVLRNFAKFTGKHMCESLFLIKLQDSACNFIKKETLAQMSSCEFGKICKNTFFYRTSPVAAFRGRFRFSVFNQKLFWNARVNIRG